MADDNAPGTEVAPVSRRGTKKAPPKKSAATKKAAPARKGPATRKAAVTDTAPAKKAAAKKSAAKKAPAKKSAAKKAAAKKSAPAKRARPAKKVAPLVTTDLVDERGAAEDDSLDIVAVADIAADEVAVHDQSPDDIAVADIAAEDIPTPDIAVDDIAVGDIAAEEGAPGRPGPMPPTTAPKRARRRGRGKLVLIVLLVLALCAVLAGGIYYLLTKDDDGGVGYTSLKAGQCFDNPPENFKKVATVPCAKVHDLEVVAVVADPSPKKTAYPGSTALVEVASAGCAPAFQAYVGLPVDQSQLRQVEIVPQKSSWDDGNRRLVCTVRSPDGAPTTGSVRGSNR